MNVDKESVLLLYVHTIFEVRNKMDFYLLGKCESLFTCSSENTVYVKVLLIVNKYIFKLLEITSITLDRNNHIQKLCCMDKSRGEYYQLGHDQFKVFIFRKKRGICIYRIGCDNHFHHVLVDHMDEIYLSRTEFYKNRLRFQYLDPDFILDVPLDKIDACLSFGDTEVDIS